MEQTLGPKKKKKPSPKTQRRVHRSPAFKLRLFGLRRGPSGAPGEEPERSGVKALRRPWMVACVRDMASYQTRCEPPLVSVMIYQWTVNCQRAAASPIDAGRRQPYVSGLPTLGRRKCEGSNGSGTRGAMISPVMLQYTCAGPRGPLPSGSMA